jgi:hypothetical protein
MKRVGEFEDAGLVLVNGDSFINGKSTSLTLTDADSACIANHAVVHSFAWRENTGLKPEFSGAIDAIIGVGDDSEQIDCAPIGDFAWCSVIKWRPSLNQPSIAESDTKESVIHKAWVALKGDLNNAKKYDSKTLYLIFCIKGNIRCNAGEYLLTNYATNNHEYWNSVCTKQEFTDYCEKMAAEELRMKVIMQNGNDGLHYGNTAQQVEALAANHTLLKPRIFRTNEDAQQSLSEHFARLADNKPIFTQAMADNVDFKGGQKVYIAQINTLAGIAEKRYFVEQFWCGSGHQREYLSLGILFGSKEQAEHKCKSLLGIDPAPTEKRRLMQQ